MIKQVEFTNFKVLLDAKLPLGNLTLLVGPNGSGKSTAVEAIRMAGAANNIPFAEFVSVGAKQRSISISVMWGLPIDGLTLSTTWNDHGHPAIGISEARPGVSQAPLRAQLANLSSYSLDAAAIAAPAPLQPGLTLGQRGEHLAMVLDQLRDKDPERFEALNAELRHWFPEFDRVLFDTPSGGYRTIALRTREKQHPIHARNLSHGTLHALAILALAYAPSTPSLICVEEPDRGIHPRLLRDVRDALYRLAYPESVGEKRDPVQVIVTTHSPYLLDLFSDHPDEIVIAHKEASTAWFEPLSQRKDLKEILEGAKLGDVWYTGVLGGVPNE